MSRPITTETKAVWHFFKENPNQEFTAREIADYFGVDTKVIHGRISPIMNADKRLRVMKELGARYRFMYVAPAATPKPKPEATPAAAPEEPIFVLAALVREQNKLLAALVSKF